MLELGAEGEGVAEAVAEAAVFGAVAEEAGVAEGGLEGEVAGLEAAEGAAGLVGVEAGVIGFVGSPASRLEKRSSKRAAGSSLGKSGLEDGAGLASGAGGALEPEGERLPGGAKRSVLLPGVGSFFEVIAHPRNRVRKEAGG